MYKLVSNIISDGMFVEIIIIGDMNCDPDKWRFFHELRSMTTFLWLHWIDIEQLPSFPYTYVTRNSTGSTNWIDQILCSNSNLVPNIEILYSESCQDHIPIYCELNINHPVEFTFDELTQTGNIKAGILWDQVTDEKMYLCCNSLECISIDLWNDVLSCHSVECESNSHNMQLENLYNTLIDAILISSNYFTRRKKRHKKRIVGWNLHCKDLNSDARHNFLVWHNIGRLRSD